VAAGVWLKWRKAAKISINAKISRPKETACGGKHVWHRNGNKAAALKAGV